MQPDPSTILAALNIREPIVGLYDAPDPTPFAPLVEPRTQRQCVFASFGAWREGKTLHITADKHGCGAPQLLGLQTRSREEMVKFLVDEEGLRASHELMGQWLDGGAAFAPRHGHVLIGPLNAEQYDYLRSVTFYVNADQLAVLVTGASYFSGPADPPVTAPFSSGCGQLAAAIGDLDAAARRDRRHRPGHASAPRSRSARLHRHQADVRVALPLGRRSRRARCTTTS